MVVICYNETLEPFELDNNNFSVCRYEVANHFHLEPAGLALITSDGEEMFAICACSVPSCPVGGEHSWVIAPEETYFIRAPSSSSSSCSPAFSRLTTTPIDLTGSSTTVTRVSPTCTSSLPAFNTPPRPTPCNLPLPYFNSGQVRTVSEVVLCK
jgi:hypothetical protein